MWLFVSHLTNDCFYKISNFYIARSIRWQEIRLSDSLFIPVRILQVCLAAVGVVDDLCRELKTAILPYCDEIMALLLQNLTVSTYLLAFV